MAENTDADDVESEDYEYDLSHDEGAAPHADAPEQRLRQPEGMHVTDGGGDYGYDAAHDMT
jgi:hypothetical protein